MGDNPPSSLSTEPPAPESEEGSRVRNRSPSAVSMSSAAGALEWDPSADVGAAGHNSSSGAKSCDLEYSLMFRTAYPVETSNFPLRKCKSGPPTISTPSASPPVPLESLVHSPIPSSSSSRVQNLKVVETPSVAEVESSLTKDDTLCDNNIVTTSSDDNNQNTGGRSRSPRVVSDASTSWEYDNEKYFPQKSMDWQVLGLTRSEIEYQNRKNSGCSSSVSSSLLVFDGDPSKKNDAFSEQDSKATKTQKTAVAHSSRTSHSSSQHKTLNIKRPEPGPSRGKVYLPDSTETPSSDPSTMCRLVTEFGNIVEGTSKENMKYEVLKKHRDLHMRRVFRQIKKLESLNEKLLEVTVKTRKRKPVVSKETENSTSSNTTTSNHRERDKHPQKYKEPESNNIRGNRNQLIDTSSQYDSLEQSQGARLISKKGSSHPQLNKPINKISQEFVITSDNELRHRAEKQYIALRSIGTQHSRQESTLEHEQNPSRKQRHHENNDRGDYSRKENIPEKHSSGGDGVKGLKIMIRKNWDGSEDRVVLSKHDKNSYDRDDKPRQKDGDKKSQSLNKSVDTGGLFKVKSTGVNTTSRHKSRRNELNSSKKQAAASGLNSRFKKLERQKIQPDNDDTQSYSDSSASDVPESGYSDTEAEVKLMPPVAFYVPLFSMTASPSGSGSGGSENKEKTGTYSKPKSKWTCDKLDSGLYNVEGPKRIQDCFKEDYAKCYQNVRKRAEIVTEAKKVRENRVAAEEIKWYLDWYEDHAMKRGTKSSQEYELLASKYKELMNDQEDFDKSIHVISEREMKERTARLMQHDVIAMQQRRCDVEMRKKKTSRIIQQIFSNNLRIRQKQQGPNVPERMKLTRK